MVARLLGVLLLIATAAPSPAAEGESPDWRAHGWEVVDAPRVYRGAELYGFINGGAELFLELGFEQATVHDLRRGSAQISVELYRMVDATAARGVYLAKGGVENRTPQLPVRHLAGRVQLSFQHGRLFAVVTDEGGAGDDNALIGIAQAIVATLSDDEPVVILGLLPSTGRVPGSERIIRGPLGLQSLLTLGEGDVLLLDDRATAVAAEYDADGVRTGLLIVEYGSHEGALSALAHLISHLDPYLTIVSRQSGRLVLEQHDGRFSELEAKDRLLVVRYRLPSSPLPITGGQ